MGTHKRSFAVAAPRTPSEPPVRIIGLWANKRTPPDCGVVARRRARRYLARRRLPRGLWPIIAAAVLVAIIFDRQIQPVLSRPFILSGQTGKNGRSTDDDDERGADPLPTPAETGAALQGQAALRCNPPAEFQAKHAAQVLAFLIRNRGKLDNAVVREKWKHLDRVSLPLAVFVRDVEAREEWSELEREISRSPLAPGPAPGSPDMPSSLRHLRILKLMQEWQRRGEELLTMPDDVSVSTDSPERRPDDDDTPPRPTR